MDTSLFHRKAPLVPFMRLLHFGCDCHRHAIPKRSRYIHDSAEKCAHRATAPTEDHRHKSFHNRSDHSTHTPSLSMWQRHGWHFDTDYETHRFDFQIAVATHLVDDRHVESVSAFLILFSLSLWMSLDVSVRLSCYLLVFLSVSVHVSLSVSACLCVSVCVLFMRVCLRVCLSDSARHFLQARAGGAASARLFSKSCCAVSCGPCGLHSLRSFRAPGCRGGSDASRRCS